jgi:[ribosomal protein S5]-alanine N-acetyltransferase
MTNLETPLLTLICCDLALAEVIVQNDDDLLADYLQLKVPKPWTEFGDPAFRWTIEHLKKHPHDTQWLTYLPVLKAENTLVGSCGYMGPPDENGMVEIGYEVAQDYRKRGIATQMAMALIDNALQHPNILVVQAHTLAEDNASVKILKKCGMVFVEELESPEDGLVWKWILRK